MTPDELGQFPRSLREVRAFVRADLARPGFQGAPPGPLTALVLVTLRAGQYCRRAGGGVPRLVKPLWALVNLTILRACFEVRISPDLLCGPGLRLEHRCQLTHVDPGTVIGTNVTLLAGSKLLRTPEGSPTIGSNVLIGARSAIIGPVAIGQGAMIAVATVVLHDVPDGKIARGMPASILEPRSS